MPHSFTDRQYRKKEVDILYKATWQEHPLYLYILCEHQTRPDRWLPLRLLSYLVRIWEFHHRRHPKSKQLPLIYPLVFYPGKQRWKYPLDLRSLMEAPSELIDSYFLQPAQLIQVQPASAIELADHPWSSTFSSTMYHVTARCSLQELEQIFPTLNRLARLGKLSYVAELVEFIIVKGDSDLLEYQKLIEKHFDPELEEQVMTLAQRFEQRGMRAGIQQGVQQGMQQGKQVHAIQTAKRMLGKGFAVDVVAELSDLSFAEVSTLQAEAFVDHD